VTLVKKDGATKEYSIKFKFLHVTPENELCLTVAAVPCCYVVVVYLTYLSFCYFACKRLLPISLGFVSCASI